MSDDIRINLDDLEYASFGEGELYGADRAEVGRRIGASKLGYGVIVLQPGKRAFPYHSHFLNEELFVVLEGEGTLRHAGEEYAIRAGDFIASPADPEQPHQIINTSNTELKYLAISTSEAPEICLYPDSDKFGVYRRNPEDRESPSHFVHIGRTSQCLAYWEDD
jgi:uncharacterized cupin superfamily protein